MKKNSVSQKKLINLAAGGKLNSAFKILKKSAVDKSDAEIWVQLSGIYGAQGNLKLSKECCEKAIQLDPKCALAYSHLGNVYLSVGDNKKAVEFSQQAVRLQQNDPSILYNFSLICRNLGNYQLAHGSIMKALELRPDHAPSHYIAGTCYQASGNLDKLVEHYTKALELQPDFIGCIVNLGYHYTNIGELDRANEYFDRALQIDQNCATARTGKADVLMRFGDKKSAYELIRSLIDTGNLTANALYVLSLLGKDYVDPQETIRLSEAMLRKPGLPNADRALLGFALGRTYDHISEYDKAFEYYRIGNTASYNIFDTDNFSQHINSIQKKYTHTYVHNHVQATDTYEEPVFIIGMPRSGTSLIEQILSKHSKVFAAGELNCLSETIKRGIGMVGSNENFPSSVENISVDLMNQLAREHVEHLRSLARNSSVIRITDKMPSNYTYVGFIEQLFPRAKIIHCQRDPRDTCLSIYFQNFQNFQRYAGDLEKIGRVYLEYKKLMDHWEQVVNIPILNVQYESVVDNAEEKAREIVAFCGLEWEDACMDFYKSKRRVMTASFDQVNKPIYNKSVARWRHYEKYLDKLLEVLQPVLNV